MEIVNFKNLDNQNYFYDFVTTMAYSQFGVFELFSRAFNTQMIRDFPNPFERSLALNDYPFNQEIKENILNFQAFTPIIFVPGFETKLKTKIYEMDINFSAGKLAREIEDISAVNLRIANMTLLSAYEKIVDKIKNDSPVMEFFRHIRNAAAHNGKFRFTSAVINNKTSELKKIAEWNGFSINVKLQGQILFSAKKDDKNSFWDLGDLVDFLLDFENHFPELKNT